MWTMERNQHISPSLMSETIQSSETIPVIDLSNPNKEVLAHAVVQASQELGIFQVFNHGVPNNLIHRLKELGTEFFELPQTEKEAIARPVDSTDVEGYTTNDKKWSDHFFHRVWPPSRINYRFWPKKSQDYKEVNEEYVKHIKKLSEELMEWLSQGLGLRPEALQEGLGGDTVEYMMKVLYYPPCKEDQDLIYGTPSHTDLNGITFIIANEMHGLQAFIDNNWIDVKYDDSGIIVLIADQIRRMSNGRYKCAEHRVTIDTEKTRISWGIFAEPNLDHVVRTLPELLTGEDNVPKFKPYVYKDYKTHKVKRLPFD